MSASSDIIVTLIGFRRTLFINLQKIIPTNKKQFCIMKEINSRPYCVKKKQLVPFNTYYYCSLNNGKLFIHDLTNNLCYTLVPSKTTESAVHFLAVFFDHVLLF